MNYYEARQRTSDGRWDWTGMNDSRIFKAGPCAGHDDGHATKEEAERHFYDWELDQLQELKGPSSTQHRCQSPGCQTFTDIALAIGGHIGVHFWLCKDHRTRGEVARIYPFTPGLTITSSY